jgi:mono/diheme cytochrome c family protein
MSGRLFQFTGIVVPAIAVAAALYLYVDGDEASSGVTIGSSSAARAEIGTANQPPPAGGQTQVPADLETPAAIQAGARLFRENCVQCHGAPGGPSPVQGLSPSPPFLLAAGRRNTPAEVFARVKNGIAGTAMPAFASLLPEESIWALAAFLHHSRGISAADFDALSPTRADASQQGR